MRRRWYLEPAAPSAMTAFDPDGRPLSESGPEPQLYDSVDVQHMLDAEREEIAALLEDQRRPNALLFAQLVRTRIGRTP
jgi:hypothetical protein